MVNATSYAVIASLIPTATLLTGNAIGTRVKMPPAASACFSYLTQGLLVGLVSIELMPEVLKEAVRKRDKASASIGFLLGSILFVGLMAGVRAEEDKKDDVVGKGKIPLATVIGNLVMLWTYGVIVGVTVDGRPSFVIALLTACTLSIDTFLMGVEESELLKEKRREWWEALLVALSGGALMLFGAFVGGKLDSGRSLAYFLMVGVAIASALSIVSQTQRTLNEIEQREKEWYPFMFLYVGFFILLLVTWFSKRLNDNFIKK